MSALTSVLRHPWPFFPFSGWKESFFGDMHGQEWMPSNSLPKESGCRALPKECHGNSDSWRRIIKFRCGIWVVLPRTIAGAYRLAKRGKTHNECKAPCRKVALVTVPIATLARSPLRLWPNTCVRSCQRRPVSRIDQERPGICRAHSVAWRQGGGYRGRPIYYGWSQSVETARRSKLLGAWIFWSITLARRVGPLCESQRGCVGPHDGH